MLIEESEIPSDCKKIYRALIHGDIIRIKYKTKYKEKFSVEAVYKQDEELDINSYFIACLRNELKLDKETEEMKITLIEKIKLIGFSVPPIK